MVFEPHVEEYAVPHLDEQISLFELPDGIRILLGEVVPTSIVAAEQFRLPQTNTAFGSIGFSDAWMDHDIVPGVSRAPIPVFKMRNIGVERGFQGQGYGVKLTLAGLYLAMDHECEVFGVSEPNEKSAGIAEIFGLEDVCEDHFGYPFHYIEIARDGKKALRDAWAYVRQRS